MKKKKMLGIYMNHKILTKKRASIQPNVSASSDLIDSPPEIKPTDIRVGGGKRVVMLSEKFS